MLTGDLQYLMTAPPQELMKLTNDIPWSLCVMIREQILSPGLDTIDVEESRWIAAGAPPVDYDAVIAYVEAKIDDHCRCEAWGTRRDGNPGRRVSFRRDRGFVWLALCLKCANDYDGALRWQNRCSKKQVLGPFILETISDIPWQRIVAAHAKKQGRAVSKGAL